VRDRAKYDGKPPQDPAVESTLEVIDDQNSMFQRGKDAPILARTTSVIFGDPAKADRRTRIQNVRGFLNRHFPRPASTITPAGTGIRIKLDNRGRGKLNRLPDHKLPLIHIIPEILCNGRYDGPHPDRKQRGHIEAWHYFIGRVSVDETLYTVKVAVRQTRDGEFLYDLSGNVDNRGVSWTESRPTP